MATKDKSTITGGLGLEEEFFEKGQEMVKEAFIRTDTISDMLAELAKEVRDETLGEMNSPITTYEKKLMLIGFFAGIVRQRAEGIREQQEFISGLLGGMLGKNPEGDDEG